MEIKKAIMESVIKASGGYRDDGSLPEMTWPGFYTLVYRTHDGEPFCGTCAAKHDDVDDPIVNVATYDEGPDIHCTSCNKTIESSYGPLSFGDPDQ